MANTTINGLTELGISSLSNDDNFIIYKKGQGTYKVTNENLKNYISSQIFNNFIQTKSSEENISNLYLYGSEDDNFTIKKISTSSLIDSITDSSVIEQILDNYFTNHEVSIQLDPSTYLGAGEEIIKTPEEGETSVSISLNDYYNEGRYYYTYDDNVIITEGPFSNITPLQSFNLVTEALTPTRIKQTLRPQNRVQGTSWRLIDRIPNYFVISEDEQFQDGKTYYEKASDSEEYYETQDSAKQEGKTYYQRKDQPVSYSYNIIDEQTDDGWKSLF